MGNPDLIGLQAKNPDCARTSCTCRSRADASVCFKGEKEGKEGNRARRDHDSSPRQKGPFGA